ncbi:hypothetical protein DEU56DRAFT_757303 [Suillus clintonianus]|uniref:uncharacterized protein n=1 Tax=Suillus clintonianus TaxID=1904413 RepID=UPI001B85B74A|nr:uncharacterized protein DEU56DRAFT_757303 [Suillus clintonianus]KAG2132810.1 hypothetical protein DEU56DRAFT_757303 [Suillus clintonianus]
MSSKRNLSSTQKIHRRIPTPHTSKSITQTSGLDVSHITDVSTNPPDEFSHQSAVSLTTRNSSFSKRSSTMRSKTKKQRSQKSAVNPQTVDLDTSDSKDHWLDLAFLDRHCTQKDYFCNYWRYMVAAEQNTRLDYFQNAIDAHERELWIGFSDDYVPSWAKCTEALNGWERSERKWEQGGWTEWRPGPMMLKVPNNNWIGGFREVLDDDSYASSRKWVDDEIHVPAEDCEDYGAIDGSSPEQVYKPHRPVERTVEPRPFIPHVTSTSFILDIPPANQGASTLPSIPSSQIPRASPHRPPSVSKHDSRTAKASRVSYAPLLIPDRTSQSSRRSRRIFTPAPTRVSSEHADNEVIQKNQEIDRMFRFLKMNTEQKVAEIQRLARSMRRGMGNAKSGVHG